VYTLELVREKGLLVLSGVVCISMERSRYGRLETWIDYGTFSQDQWRTILCRRMQRANPPLIEIHPFEGGTKFILPDDMLDAQIASTRVRKKFLNHTAYELFDAEKVLILS
jgi:hypothetical protein